MTKCVRRKISEAPMEAIQTNLADAYMALGRALKELDEWRAIEPRRATVQDERRETSTAKQTESSTYSIAEAARLLGVGYTTLYDAIKRGEIVGVRIGRRILIPRRII